MTSEDLGSLHIMISAIVQTPCIVDFIYGNIVGVVKGDTRSLDYSSFPGFVNLKPEQGFIKPRGTCSKLSFHKLL